MARSSSRKTADAPPRKTVDAPKEPKERLHVTLTPETSRRLRAACAAEDMDPSEIAELLFDRHLSGYVVQVRGERIRRDSDGPASLSAPVLPDDRAEVLAGISHAAPAPP